MPNYYFNHNLAQAHCQDLSREAEHEQLLAQLPQPDRSILQSLPARLTLFLRTLYMRLRQGGQRRERPVYD